MAAADCEASRSGIGVSFRRSAKDRAEWPPGHRLIMTNACFPVLPISYLSPLFPLVSPMPFPIDPKYVSDTERKMGVKFPPSFVVRMVKNNGGELSTPPDSWQLYRLLTQATANGWPAPAMTSFERQPRRRNGRPFPHRRSPSVGMVAAISWCYCRSQKYRRISAMRSIGGITKLGKFTKWPMISMRSHEFPDQPVKYWLIEVWSLKWAGQQLWCLGGR